ncbi:MAG: MBL fold metallo-hydrolase [Gemmatimonadota bacterium]|nr:MBL fold metallo-hydrolase [Gemmatimonadota bacterium]
MQIECLTVGAFQSNCYLLIEERDRSAYIIDPGDEPDRLLDWVGHMGVSIDGIILTHAHLDHIMAVRRIKEAFKVDIFLHQEDLFIYEQMVERAAEFGWSVEPTLPVDRYIAENDIFNLDGIQVSVLHTPGHSPGGLSLFIDGNPGVVFSGDALFAGSVGRTDLSGGDYQTLIDSISKKLLTLAPDTVVYPGHGPSTTIERERLTNPFLKGIIS